MKSIEKIFESFSREYRVGENFEARVFNKIKREKVIRKARYSSLLVLSLFLILYLIFLIFPVAIQEENREIRYANRFSEPGKQMGAKEEIPVMEKVYFASFDERTDYAIEQVVLTEEEGGI